MRLSVEIAPYLKKNFLHVNTDTKEFPGLGLPGLMRTPISNLTYVISKILLFKINPFLCFMKITLQCTFPELRYIFKPLLKYSKPINQA